MTEVKLLQKEVSRLTKLVASQEEVIKKLQKEAELAITDSLTGLPNRRAFDRHIPPESTWQNARRFHV